MRSGRSCASASPPSDSSTSSATAKIRGIVRSSSLGNIDRLAPTIECSGGPGRRRPSLQVSDPGDVPAALRRDVGYLGRLLGRVLVESGGAGLLDDVERLRLASIEFRKDPAEARRDAVSEMVAALDVERAALVARAFTIYFHLVNLAEERHRVRALRERARGPEPVPESIEAAVVEIRSREGEDALRYELDRLAISPVVTTHPTEARRRSVVDALRRIAGLLSTLEQAGESRTARAHVERRLLEEITLLWRTDHLRSRRPGPLDEVRTAMVAFDETIFRAVPQLYRELDRVLGPDDVGARDPASRAFVRWGSWVGADRDGNPEVTAEVTRAAAGIQADHLLRGLEAVARRIASALTASTASTPASPELLASLALDEQRFPDVAASLRERFQDQPHRRKLALVAERLSATRRQMPEGYEAPDELLRDVGQVQRSLVAAGAPRAAFGELQHLRWQVETFGFHLASLEVRQHSAVHARVVAELVGGGGNVLNLADLATLDRLAREGWPEGADPSSEEAAEVIETLRAMAEIQSRYGPEACRRGCGARAGAPGGAGRVAPARRGAAVRVPGRPRGRASSARRAVRAALDGEPARGPGSRGRGHVWLLRLGEGGRVPGGERRAPPGPGRPRRVGSGERRSAHAVPRAGRGSRPGRGAHEPGHPQPSGGLGGRPVQGDRAGRDGLRPIRRHRDRAAAPRAGRERGPPGLHAGGREGGEGGGGPVRRTDGPYGGGVRARLPRTGRATELRPVLRASHADRGDRGPPRRVPARPTR